MLDDASALDQAALRERVAALEEQLAASKREAAAIRDERDRLREAYRHLQLELELQRRRLYVAKAERIDTAQLDLEFAATLAKLEEVAGRLGEDDVSPADEPPSPGGPRRRPTGRRTLRDLPVPEERIVLVDPLLDGKAERMGAEETSQMVWRRGGMVRLVTERIKYRPAGMPTDADFDPTIRIAPLPPQILPRSIAGPSLLAHIATDKFCDGLPLYRQEDRFKRIGAPIDRGSMSRWLEELGAIMGSSIVHAMRTDALANAFCLATDATGVLVQPARDGDTARRACRRAHFFVLLADADHIFFDYTAKETSAVVSELFRDFGGYVQADAKSVYDILFRPPDQRRPLDDDEVDRAVRLEVGCWSHVRTKFWEAAITKDVVAREGLARIRRIFELDRSCKGRPPAEIKALRDQHLRPHVDAFFAWVDVEYERVKGQRGFLRTALGYAQRQQGALVRFFDDGRLKLDNNACLLYTSPSPRDRTRSRMPSSA